MSRTTHRRRLALALSATLVLPVAGLGTAQAQDASAGPTVDRVSGDDRYATAVAISQRAFASADTVVLAVGTNYADALTGGPLAASLGGPLLLTRAAALPDGVLAEIQRLGATDVVILGGEAAVSADVQSELETAGLTVTRRAGADRFATAADIADALAGDADSVPLVFVVEGADPDPLRGWPDAVSVAAYAAYLGAPILTVRTDAAPQATLDALAALNPEEVVIVGGIAAVSQAVEDSLAETYTVRRIAGDDRYATSSLLYGEAITAGMSPTMRWLATGQNFPDALAAGPAASTAGSTLGLVRGQNLTPEQAATYRHLTATPDLVEEILFVGGPNAISTASAGVVLDVYAPPAEASDFCLTVLHNNDGESQLIDAGSGLEDFGGAARFATRLMAEQAAAEERAACTSSGVLTVTSGDNFLAGPEFNASRANAEDGGVFYDSILYQYLHYDAIDLGNHDFDFGPDVAAEFISGIFDAENPAADEGNTPVFLSANLDVSAEAALQAEVDAGHLDGSTVVDLGGTSVGVIGLTTPILRTISSPGGVVVGGLDADGNVDVDALKGFIDAEIAAMGDDVDIIVLISHLQGIGGDLDLIAELSGVDIVVAGGGDEVLANPGDPLVPGDALEPLEIDEDTTLEPSYPLVATDADGAEVPVVTTAGSYKYVGRLDARFDGEGNLESVDPSSRMVRVAGGDLFDAVEADTFVQENVVDPVVAFLSDLATDVIATSEVVLDGRRPSVRTQETNEGNLLADALRATAMSEAADFGLDPDADFVAFQNGGGIRNDTQIGEGETLPFEVTRLDTYDIAPFSNFVSVFEDVTAAELDAIFEHAYSGLPAQEGRFAQVSNLVIEVDADQPAGERIADGGITLLDGSPIPAEGVSLVTIDFLARGGDGYPVADLGDFTAVGVSYQAALANFIEFDLGGEILEADYPTVGTDPAGDGAQRILYS